MATNTDKVDVVALHDEFFNVIAEAFPKLLHLHYGCTPASEDSRSLFGLVGRSTRGQLRLLDEMCAAAGMADWPAASHGLDLGCGLGGTSLELHRRYGFRMTGLNINRQQCGQARRRVDRYGTEADIAVVRGDGTGNPLRTGSFDFVVAIEIAFHVGRKDRLFAEVARVLRPGGRFVLVDQEWAEETQAHELMFYPERGTYERLAADCGMTLERHVDLSADVARWMVDYARMASPALSAATVLGIGLSGRPRLAWRFAKGFSFFNRFVLEDAGTRGLDVEGVGRWGAVRRLRQFFAEELASGRAVHGVWVLRREERSN